MIPGLSKDFSLWTMNIIPFVVADKVNITTSVHNFAL